MVRWLRLTLPLVALAAFSVGPLAGCRVGAGSDDAVLGDAEEVPDDSVARGPLATHHNARYGFTVAYPARLLPAVWPRPEGGDSRGFLARNDEAALRAYGRSLRPGEGLERERERLVASYDTVAYQALLDSAFVVSGFRDDLIAYTKVVRREDRLLTLEVEYPSGRRALYDRVVEAVAPAFPDAPIAGAPSPLGLRSLPPESRP